jgi:hypothetical protein
MKMAYGSWGVQFFSMAVFKDVSDLITLKFALACSLIAISSNIS